MPDAGSIKFTVEGEYNGGAIKAAKEDIASLGDAAGGAGGGIDKATEATSALGDVAKESGLQVSGLAGAIDDVRKPAGAAEDAVSSMNDAIGESTGIVEDATKAHENLATQLDNVSPAINDLATQAKAASPQLAKMGDAAGSTADNLSAFSDILENPYPFQTLQSHLADTGQSYSDFATSIGEDNAHLLKSVAQVADMQSLSSGFSALTPEQMTAIGPETVWSQAASDITSMGSAVDNTISPFADLNAATKTNATVTTAAEQAQSSFIDTTTKASQGFQSAGGDIVATNADIEKSFASVKESLMPKGQDPLMGMISDFGGGVGDAVSGVMGALGDMMMPMMALQMVGMGVSALGQGMYDAAAIAEGPAAHGLGTFTGAIDVMTQQSAKAGQAFSEGFGQQILPTLAAINNVDPTGWNGFVGGVGSFLGFTASSLIDTAMAAGGMVVNAAGGGTGIRDAGLQGLENQYDTLTGQPLAYPGPAPDQQAQIQQQIAAATASLPAQLAIQTATLNYQAQDTSFLAAQANYSSQMAKAQEAQAGWNDSHPGNSTGPTDPMNAAQRYDAGVALGVTGLGNNPDPNAQWASQLLGMGGNTDFGAGMGGCFPAGTRVLCPDGTERPIETLRVGDSVAAHDGTERIIATILACISYTHKQTYELLFSDGNALTLTDSHPVATIEGWKSLSPSSTKQENPGLYVLPLHTGDRVYTSDGSLCAVIAIHSRAIVTVYNITVDKTHTYYANGVLVHNAKLGALSPSVGDTASGVTKNVPITVTWTLQGILDKVSQQTSGWGLAGILDKVSQQFSGWGLSGVLDKNSTQKSGWDLMGELAKTAMQQSGWGLMGQLAQTSMQESGWGLMGQLAQMSMQTSGWGLMGELAKTAIQTSGWGVVGDLAHTFLGAPKWDGKDLDHTFEATANWVASNLNPTFMVSASFLGLAAGVIDNPHSQIAMIGENGPELMFVPQGASIFPNGVNPFGTGVSGTGSGTPSMGMGGGGSASSGPVTIQLYVDSMMLAQSVLPQIAPLMRMNFGVRR